MYNKKGRSHPEGGCPALPLSRRMTSREFLYFSDQICVSHRPIDHFTRENTREIGTSRAGSGQNHSILILSMQEPAKPETSIY